MDLLVTNELLIHQFFADDVHLTSEVIFEVGLGVLKLSHHQVELIITLVSFGLQLYPHDFGHVLLVDELLQYLDVRLVNLERECLVNVPSALLDDIHVSHQVIRRVLEFLEFGLDRVLVELGLGLEEADFFLSSQQLHLLGDFLL